MNKILITLVVPSVEEKFDVWLPDFLTIKELIGLLTQAVSDITQNMYATSGGEILCRSNPAMVLNTERTLLDYGVAHGECLYLF